MNGLSATILLLIISLLPLFLIIVIDFKLSKKNNLSRWLYMVELLLLIPTILGVIVVGYLGNEREINETLFPSKQLQMVRKIEQEVSLGKSVHRIENKEDRSITNYYKNDRTNAEAVLQHDGWTVDLPSVDPSTIDISNAPEDIREFIEASKNHKQYYKSVEGIKVCISLSGSNPLGSGLFERLNSTFVATILPCY